MNHGRDYSDHWWHPGDHYLRHHDLYFCVGATAEKCQRDDTLASPQAASPSPRPRAKAASTAPPPSSVSQKSGFSLGRLASVFWGVIALMCLQEGATFGEPFLIIIGIGFFYLAYIMWKK